MSDMRIEAATAVAFLRIAERSWYPFHKPFSTRIAKAVADYLEESLKAKTTLKEAVLGGSACHSVEQHMPETTTKGEQAD